SVVLENPRPLPPGAAGRRFHRAGLRRPLRGRVLPRAGCAPCLDGRRYRSEPRPVAEHPVDPGRNRPGDLGVGAARTRERAQTRQGMSERSLADSFRRLIASSGPISLAQFMGESNARYYAGRDPFGVTGDFITAPEISQMFGELIGLWLADIWFRAGSPAHPLYVELGPGRGTLARDALRAMRQAGLEPEPHLVEGSPELRRLQAQAVPSAQFHHDLSTVPEERPMLLVANEFVDALPIRQLVMTE